jgi:hypothetical protein
MLALGARKKKVCVRHVCVGRVCVGLGREIEIVALPTAYDSRTAGKVCVGAGAAIAVVAPLVVAVALAGFRLT